MPVRSTDLGAKLCEIFGLDASSVRKLEIILDPAAVAVVKIEQFISKSHAGAIETLLRSYTLEAKPEEEKDTTSAKT